MLVRSHTRALGAGASRGLACVHAREEARQGRVRAGVAGQADCDPARRRGQGQYGWAGCDAGARGGGRIPRLTWSTAWDWYGTGMPNLL